MYTWTFLDKSLASRFYLLFINATMENIVQEHMFVKKLDKKKDGEDLATFTVEQH